VEALGTRRLQVCGKRAVDSTGQSESEICSHQDPIVHLSCWISTCNCQHHDREASWDLVTVATLKIRFRLWYWPMSRFRPPPPATHHPPPATQLPPPPSHLQLPATCLPVPGACNSTSLWIEHAGAYSEGVESSTGSFWLLENSEFVDALSNRRL